MAYECFACRQALLVDSKNGKCPSCGSTKGQVISAERVKEAFGRGTYFNIDPKTGKRSKKKPR